MQKKAFRIEELLAHDLRRGRDGRLEAAPAAAMATATVEVAAPRHALEQMQQAMQHGCRELGLLSQHGGERLRRTAVELGVVATDTEAATQKVLDNVEAIDDAAKTLSAALRNDNNQALAQDIQEHVTRIYEACNFQDLIGQRITNALAALRMVEAQIVAVIAMFDGVATHAGATAPARSAATATAQWTFPDALLNGPPLPGAPGHTTQREIDGLFG